jgi:hypothetical protein
MNTDHFSALGAGPPFLLVSDELSYADHLYIHEIVNHAHAILGSVAMIQMFQPVAGKPVTAEAVPDLALFYFLAVFDSAGDAGF